MTFVQIVSFRTDHLDQLQPLEATWKAATEGRRTLLDERVLVSRSDPRHVFTVNEFESYESAMVNSNLPETTALAQEFGRLVDGEVEYFDLDLVLESDVRRELAALLHQALVTSTVPDGLFTDDATFDGYFPGAVQRASGPAVIEELLREETPGRDIELWDVAPTANGFAAEYTYRTTGGPVSHLSIGTVLATLTAGRISRLLVTCAGSWDAEAEARILGSVGAAS
jgi:hypothetical protein